MKLILNLESLKDVNQSIDALVLLRSLYAEEATTQAPVASEPEQLQLRLTPSDKPQRPRRARKADDAAKTEPVPIPEEPKAQPLSDDKLQQLLALARERGIEWARSTLSGFGVKKFSELLDDEAAAILGNSEARAA
jgi:hypothetical protein